MTQRVEAAEYKPNALFTLTLFGNLLPRWAFPLKNFEPQLENAPQLSQRGPFPGSSTVEHSAINRELEIQ
jgi:hypothetical protein